MIGPNGGFQLQRGIVVGSICTINEQPLDEALLPAHCDWDPPTYPDGQTVLADGSVEPHKLRVSNSITCRYGDIKVQKRWGGISPIGGPPATGPSGVFYNIDLTCSDGTTGSASIQEGGEHIFTNIPDSAVCTVSETLQARSTTDEDQDCVVVPDSQQLRPREDDESDFGWSVGTALSIPAGGDLITGDLINNIQGTSSHILGFDDVYSAGIGLNADMSYGLNDHWQAVAGLSWQFYEGGFVSLGSINGIDLTGELNDLNRLQIDAGLRYNFPKTPTGGLNDILPYIYARLGPAHSSKII